MSKFGHSRIKRAENTYSLRMDKISLEENYSNYLCSCILTIRLSRYYYPLLYTSDAYEYNLATLI